MNPKPFNTGYLARKDGHEIFYSQYGNPKGQGIVSLHGGPGSKSKPKYVKGYELDKYHIIAFDQRGCGNSVPAGKILNNTTQDLLDDMERLRNELKIDSWFVAGSSWGAALALAYAEHHPQVVRGLLLGSVFLGRTRDVEWAFTHSGGVERMFPDLWEKRLEFLNKYKATPADAIKLLKLLSTSSEDEVKEIVAGVSNWEGNLMNAQEDLTFLEPEEVGESDIAAVKIFLHYEAHGFFLNDNQLLDGLSKIKDIPTVIVHGRYDILCPVEQVWELQKGLKDVEVIILPTSNHALTAEGEIARNIAFNYFLSKHR